MSLLLSARGLGKAYVAGLDRCWARVQVLSRLSLSLGPGERVLVLGARGSGKTTLLHCLVGLRRLDTGSIRWDATHGAPYRLCRSPADLAHATRWRAALAEFPDDEAGSRAWHDGLWAGRAGDGGWLILANRGGGLLPLAHRVLTLREGALHASAATGRLPRVAEGRASAGVA